MANISTPSMQDLLSAGVHFGHKVSRGHPRMKSYIFGARDGVHIIDLAKSEELLKEATQAAYELGKQGKTLLIVGTKKQAQEIVKDLALQAESPYMNKRWVGGFFTNFDEVRKNTKMLNDLKVAQDKGELSMYTKREQLLISRKLEKYHTELGGIANVDKLPDAIFLVDAVSDITAVKEANRMKIMLIGLSDTNTDPTWFDYPVPANDDGIKSIKLICETVIGAYIKGKKEFSVSGAATAETKPAEETKEAPKKEAKKEAKKEESKKEAKDEAPKEEKLDQAVAEEAAVLEEEIEKKVLEESERKVE